MANGVDNPQLVAALQELTKTLKGQKSDTAASKIQYNAEEQNKINAAKEKELKIAEKLLKLQEIKKQADEDETETLERRQKIDAAIAKQQQVQIETAQERQNLELKSVKDNEKLIKQELERNKLIVQNNKARMEELRANKELTKAQKEQLEILKEQTDEIEKQIAEQEAAADKGLQTFDKVKKGAKAVKDGFKEVFSGLKDVANAGETAANTFGGLEKGVLSFDTAVAQAKKINSLSVDLQRTSGLSEDLTKTIVSSQKELRRFGISSEDVAGAFNTLGIGLSDFTRMDKANRDELAKSVVKFKNLGVSVQGTTKLLETGTKTLGMSQEEAMILQEDLVKTARAIGVAPSRMVEGFASAAPKLAAHGSSMEKVFKGLALQSKNTGASIDQLLGVAEGFDTFEAAATKTSQLNAMFGTQLNSVELLNATEEERIQILQSSLAATGKSIDQMGRFELKSLAQIIGVDVATVRQTFGAAEDGLDDLEKKAGAAKSEVNLEEELEKTVKIQDKLNSANEAFKNTTNDVTKGLQNQAQELATNQKLMSRMETGGKGLSTAMNASMEAARTMAEHFDKIAISTAGLDLTEKIASPISNALGGLMNLGGGLLNIATLGRGAAPGGMLDRMKGGMGDAFDFVGDKASGAFKSTKNFVGSQATKMGNFVGRALPTPMKLFKNALASGGKKLVGPLLGVIMESINIADIINDKELSKKEKAKKVLSSGAGAAGGAIAGVLTAALTSFTGPGAIAAGMGASVLGDMAARALVEQPSIQELFVPYVEDMLPDESNEMATNTTTAQAETPVSRPVSAPTEVSSPTPALRPPVVTPAATMSSAQADRIVSSNMISQNAERNSESSVFNIYCKIGDKDVLADVVKVAMNDGFKTGGIATS